MRVSLSHRGLTILGRAPGRIRCKTEHDTLTSMHHPPFVAIDFETADTRPESACALGAVRVESGERVARFETLLCPPPSSFRFTKVHGIRAEDVTDAPRFRDVWPELEDLLGGARFLAAHHAPFDRSVLQVLCLDGGILAPRLPFVCTRLLALRAFEVPSGDLVTVCTALGFSLRHHNPLSDAEAAASIVLRAYAEGVAVLRE